MKHSIINTQGKWINYLSFDSVHQWHEFVALEHARKLSAHNRKLWSKLRANTLHGLNNGTEWFGSPSPESIAELERHNRFLGMPLVSEVKKRIEKHLASFLELLNQEVLPKPSLAYNDRGLGLFCFERAAMGLSPLVPTNFEQPLEKTICKLKLELNKQKVTTQVKQVYAHFENKQLATPALRLFLLAGANANIEGNAMLYTGLACAILVEFMALRGVPVQVHVLLGSSFQDQSNMAAIRVKSFQETIDQNQLLLLSSDPRYFRYRGFQGIIALGNHFDLDVPSGLGEITPNMAKDFVAGYDEKAFVFEQCYSLESAVMQVEQVVAAYKTLRL